MYRMKLILIIVFLFKTYLIFSQWGIESGVNHDFIKRIDNDNSILWNHSNRFFIGGEHLFQNRLIISSAIGFEKLNVHYNRTRVSLNCKKTNTYFQGRSDYIFLDIQTGYSFKISDNSSLNIKFGVNPFVMLKTKIKESYQAEYRFSDCNDESTLYLERNSFFDGASSTSLNQTFKDRLTDLKFSPVFNINFRRSLSDNIEFNASCGYTITFGHTLRMGVGIVYIFNKKSNINNEK